MKKIIFFIFGMALLLSVSSCEKDETPNPSNQEEMLIEQITSAQNIQILQVDEVPESINIYVKNTHAPFGIEMVYHAPHLGYEVMLENGFCLFFNKDTHHLNHDGMHNDWGNHHNSGYSCLTGDTLSLDAVPQEVIDFIAVNYPGNNITSVILKPSGKLIIELENGEILFFTPYGDYLQECDIPNGQGTGMHGHQHINFGDNSWHCGGDGMGGHHGGMGGHHGTNNTDNWEGPCWGGTGIAIEDIPPIIDDYVSINYPDATIEFVMQTYDNNFFLRLSDCVRIVFDEAGNLIFDSGL